MDAVGVVVAAAVVYVADVPDDVASVRPEHFAGVGLGLAPEPAPELELGRGLGLGPELAGFVELAALAPAGVVAEQ